MSGPSPALLLAGAALIVALGGVAVGAPGAGGVIKGCANNLRGELRVIDSSERCADDEFELVWNQQGPQGIQGPPGPRGEDYNFETPSGSLLTDTQSLVELPKRREWPKVKARPQGKKKPKLNLSPSGEPTRVFSVRGAEFKFLALAESLGGKRLTLARLVLLPGKYAVTGKAFLDAASAWDCALSSSAGAKVSDVAIEKGFGTAHLMLEVETKKPAAIELSCQPFVLPDGGTDARAAIRAINVASISHKTYP